MKKIIFLSSCFCFWFLNSSAQNSITDTLKIKTVEITSQRPHRYTDTIPSSSLRLNVPLIEVPQNIVVINQDAMKDLGLNQISDATKITGGIHKIYGIDNDFSYTIRGFDATNSDFRNGIGGYWWNQQADAFMLEKFEIVKGPAGFMIANAEPGGIINEVTKQADGKKIREIELSYGSYNLSRLGIDIGDKFSEKSKFSYRLVAGGQYTQSSFDFYKSHRLFLVSSLRYTYKNNSDIQVEYNGMNGHHLASGYVNASYDCKDHFYPESFNLEDVNAVSGYQTNDNFIRISNNQYFKKGWHLRSQIASAWGIYNGDQMFMSNLSATFDTIYREYQVLEWNNSLYAAQSYLDGKFHTGSKIEHAVLTGVEYGNTFLKTKVGFYDVANFGNHLPISVSGPQYNLTNEQMLNDTTVVADDKTRTVWGSWFGMDQIKFYDRFILILGCRYTYTELTLSWDSTTVYSNSFTPRYGLMYLINKNLSVYAVLDESFLPQSGPKLDGTNPKPLTGANNELGFKAELFNKRFMFNASLFQITKNNVLVNVPQTEFYEERGQIISKGFELSATGNLNSNILIIANYSYIDATITEDPDTSLIGFPAHGVPQHAGNVNVRYRFLKGKLNGLSLGIGVQLIGEKSAAIPYYTDPVEKDKMGPAFNLVDANLGYEIKKFRFHFNVYNVLNNQKYFEHADWRSSFNPDVKGYYVGVAHPISFRFTAGYSF